MADSLVYDSGRKDHKKSIRCTAESGRNGSRTKIHTNANITSTQTTRDEEVYQIRHRPTGILDLVVLGTRVGDGVW